MTYDAAPSRPQAVPTPSGRPQHVDAGLIDAGLIDAGHIDPVLIDCGTCCARGIECGDCVVTVLLGGPPFGVSLNADERRALDVLAAAGLIPPLRHDDGAESLGQL